MLRLQFMIAMVGYQRNAAGTPQLSASLESSSGWGMHALDVRKYVYLLAHIGCTALDRQCQQLKTTHTHVHIFKAILA